MSMKPLHPARLAALTPLLLLASSAASRAADVQWHDLAEWPIEGKGWPQTKYFSDRLPPHAEGNVRPPVWSLSHDSAGLRYRFVTDADAISARWEPRKTNLALAHMPATGVSGLDLYVREGEKWHWLAVGKPDKPGVNEKSLVQGLTKQKREYCLYLPLYNGISSISIGVPAGATFEQAPDRYAGRKPIVFYGTSILQGGCASRPGMAYPSILGRALDWPTINLGFSGNGKTEPEVAKLLAELDPAVYVLDSLPNLSPAEARERVEPFVKTLRDAHPRTPIVLVEHVKYCDGPFVESRRAKFTEDNAILRSLYDRLKQAGDANLFYVPADRLLGPDGEDTVDGTHPTDLGFFRMAEGMLPVIKEALDHSR